MLKSQYINSIQLAISRVIIKTRRQLMIGMCSACAAIVITVTCWLLHSADYGSGFVEQRHSLYVFRTPMRQPAGSRSVIITNRVHRYTSSVNSSSETSSVSSYKFSQMPTRELPTWIPKTLLGTDPLLLHSDSFGWPIPWIRRTLVYCWAKSDYIVIEGMELRSNSDRAIEERVIAPTKIIWINLFINIVIYQTALSCLTCFVYAIIISYRASGNRCSECGYSMEDATAAVCPECGTEWLLRSELG